MRHSLGTPLPWLAAVGLALAPLRAGPLEELESLAQLPAIDLAQLKRGAILTQRGALGAFPRGINIESCYFIDAPLEVVGEALLHWNPLPHRDLEVRLYHEYSLPPAPDVFESLQLNASVPENQWLLERMADVANGQGADGLHLTSEEVALVRKNSASENENWQEILRRRSDALARGGMAAVAPYGSDTSISPGSEFRGLLTLAPKAAQHFQAVTRAPPMAARGKPASEAVAYWDATKVRDHTTLELGLLAAQKSSASWQLIDCIYYPTDTYFMALDLYQLWPLDGGTLVWQVGFVSAPFRSYFGGVDRFVAGKQMTQQTLDKIKAFRSDVEKRR